MGPLPNIQRIFRIPRMADEVTSEEGDGAAPRDELRALAEGEEDEWGAATGVIEAVVEEGDASDQEDDGKRCKTVRGCERHVSDTCAHVRRVRVPKPERGE